MIIEIPDENSIIKWKYNDGEDWKIAEISDLIKAYERPPVDIDLITKRHEEIGFEKGFNEGYAQAVTDKAEPQITVIAENASAEEIANFKAQLKETLNEMRPKGHWVEKQETPRSVSYYCSNCKCAGLGVENFCSWCGADMRKEKDNGKS